jgi:hypothetical protein
MTMNDPSNPKNHDSGADVQTHPQSFPVELDEGNSLLALEQRGILPTAEYPVLYRALGKNGFGLFLYLEEGLNLQTLDRLAKCTERTALIKHLVSER